MVVSFLGFLCAHLSKTGCQRNWQPRHSPKTSLISVVKGQGKGEPSKSENLGSYHSTPTNTTGKNVSPTYIKKADRRAQMPTFMRLQQGSQHLCQSDVRESQGGRQNFHPHWVTTKLLHTASVETTCRSTPNQPVMSCVFPCLCSVSKHA